jgi:hypothetical protein
MGEKVLAFLYLEFGAGELISVVYNFKLSGVDVDDCTDKDVFELEGSVLASFQEDTFVFYVELSVMDGTISMFLSLI